MGLGHGAVHAVEAGLQAAAVGLGLPALAREAEREMAKRRGFHHHVQRVHDDDGQRRAAQAHGAEAGLLQEIEQQVVHGDKAAAATITRQSW